ncbi:sodium channel protein Nach-like [Schistocerca americana]|uniref:sodium channel protein Nach-like n=1 Tax=Schistocerca americana TaxID=7009 RepID=UPI001F4FABE1|nr:sodium channel protein Nach-like [Schistocerca americana]
MFLATAIGCTVATCLSTWNRYRTNPTSVSMTHDYNEWILDFPASYVCPSSKVDPESLNITSARLAGENASEERQQRVRDYLRAVANASLRRLGALRRFAGDRSLPQSDLLQLVLEVKFNFSHTAANVPPLRMTLLEEGVCYYSNARVALLASPLPKEEESGVTASKYVTSVDHVDITGSVSYMNTGYKLFVSSPDEIPNMMSAGHSAMQLSQLEMFVGVLPMSATEALLSLRVEQRRCRQAHESPLGISPDYYTYGLCRLQCRIDLATKLCGCVPYFYPRQAGQKECDIKGMMCLHDHEEEMVTLPEGLADCDCLPRCSERHYYPLDYKLLDK